MTTKEILAIIDRELDSRNLVDPNIRKRALRKVLSFMRSTGEFLSGEELTLPADRKVMESAYAGYKGKNINGAEKNVIKMIYDYLS